VPAGITNTCCEDSYGNVWFGSSTNGIFRFNTQKNSFEFFKEYHEAKTTRKFDNVYGIAEAGERQLYLLSLFAGLTKFNYKNDSAKVWRESDGLATDANSEFIKDNNGNLWLAGYQDVSLLNIKSNTIRRFRMDYASTNYSYYNVVSLLRNGNVCISFLDAIAVFDPSKLERAPNIHPVLISNFSVFENSIPYTQRHPGIDLNYKQNFFSFSFSSF
jgi:ligand-binding sensor domain-containing protein